MSRQTRAREREPAPTGAPGPAGGLRDPPTGVLLAGFGLAALLATAGYARTLGAGFVLDDQTALVENARIRDLGAFARPGVWLQPAGRPLTELTFALQYRLARLDPAPYRVLDLALHLAVAASLWFLGRRILERLGWPRSGALALAAAALFATHPLQAEAVSYVAQRAEVLAALLSTLAVLLLLPRAGEDAPGPARLAAGGAAFLLGLAAKPSAAVAPLLLVVAVEGTRGPGDRRVARLRSIAIALPLAAISACAALAALGTQGPHSSAGFSMPDPRPAEWFLTQPRVLFRTLALLAWPAGQTVDPDVGWSTSLWDPATFAALAGLAALVGVAAIASSPPPQGASSWRAAARIAALGLGWFLVAILPASLVPLRDAMAEHRAYLGSWGLLLAGAALGDLALRRAGPRVSAAVGLAACAALALALHARNAAWESDLALWRDAVAKAPGKARPHAGLAYALAVRGREAEAAAELRAALRTPIVPTEEARVRGNLAITLMDEGRLDEARAEVARALALDPGLAPAHNTLGELRLLTGDAAGALQAFRRAAALAPASSVHQANVAAALERVGRPGEACAEWLRYLDLEPDARVAARTRAELARRGCAAAGAP